MLCTGREPHQELARQWALSLHGQFVTIPFYLVRIDGKFVWTRVPVLAVKIERIGGWCGIKVYISKDRPPNWGGYRMQLYGDNEDHDVVDGHRLYYIIKGRPQREDVLPLVVEDMKGELNEMLKLGVAGELEKE